MKTFIQYSHIITVLLLIGTMQAQTSEGAGTIPFKDAYADGLFAEERDQDYAKAAEHYQAVIQAFDAQREEAANAIFRLAECLRKLNRQEEAKVQYARILREFPDFEELTRQTHMHLAPQKLPPSQTSSPEVPVEMLQRYGLLSDDLRNELKRTEKFLELMAIDASVGIYKQQIGIWVNVEEEELRVAEVSMRKLYGAEKIEELRDKLVEINDLTMTDGPGVIPFDYLKPEKLFYPIMPDFFVESALQKWNDAKIWIELKPQASKRYTIIGEIINPDVYQIPEDGGIDMVQAIARAGGFTPNAKTSRISRFRNGEEKHFNFDELLKRKETGDADVIDGDRILVNTRYF